MTVDALSLSEAVAERERILTDFLETHQDRLARACLDMAKAFVRGGVLIPFGVGAAATDAAHVAVEFMHPVIVGKRALPAVAPTNDPTSASRAEVLGRHGDIALSISHGTEDAAAAAFLGAARRSGMLTIALQAGEPTAQADHVLAVASADPAIVQEVQETAYHVLWELVHVFFEHPGLLDEACITCGDVAVEAVVVEVEGPRALVERDGVREEVAVDLVEDVRRGDRLLCHAGVALERTARDDPPPEARDTGFLYPFLESEERDAEAVFADVRASSVRKGQDVMALRRAIDLQAVAATAAMVREALEDGGRLLVFGNGGSATDAQDLAADALHQGWPAIALVNDSATVTAVANDVGFDNVFARQVIALGRRLDVAVAITTSGSSPNVLAGLDEAHRRQMRTIAITGYSGGAVGGLPFVDHLLMVEGDYIPRLQEAHATIYHLILDAVGSAT
jgi:D-sedoheptulose 7-phosphate isomerase